MIREKISCQESDNMQSTISRLVMSHNLLTDIEEFFRNNSVAAEYFDAAYNEVLESGNCGLSAMYKIALDNMCRYIKDQKRDEDENYVNSLLSRIRKLESENRKLKMQVEAITTIIEGKKE